MVQDRDNHGEAPVFRFAPSPNGNLHLGHAYSAILNHDLARTANGTLLLRLEDIDRERCREVYAESILEDLGWLGIAWAGEPRRQSRHFGVYRTALDGLERRGLVYPCFCTRAMILGATASTAPRRVDPDGTPLYPGTCRHLSSAERSRRRANHWPATLRLDMARATAEIGQGLDWTEVGEDGVARIVPAVPAAWGDAIVARKDIATSYHVSVVVDDAAQGVTDVVRGRDLYYATALHRLLQRLLGVPAPRYHHHRLIVGADGRKLSKSRAAPALRTWRQDGKGPADVRQAIDTALETQSDAPS